MKHFYHIDQVQERELRMKFALLQHHRELCDCQIISNNKKECSSLIK